ncbi:DUF1349 domain-containing protein [Marispirochaeta sp.]|uniref:DUF1349 domain-containing protein n=1 Tax=Marispirochaeta sp. TaxID=2038653 RepID=UPI0029C7909D|nr:DUF1349 domain-containing protein [Marispirochaeta sp.]
MSLIENGRLNSSFIWLNESEYRIDGESLIMITQPETDFWQRTHYGFRRDNGHCLLANESKDFCMSVKTEYHAAAQYDQAGLFVRIDSENWIKTSTEYESEMHSRLGSVVTNNGYSDWASIDVEGPVNEMWYRIQSKNALQDYLIEYSPDGKLWKQLRITHLLNEIDMVKIGIYACSPMKSSFEAKYTRFEITESQWSA